MTPATVLYPPTADRLLLWTLSVVSRSFHAARRGAVVDRDGVTYCNAIKGEIAR